MELRDIYPDCKIFIRGGSIKFSKKLSEKKKLVFLLGRNDLETITAYISFINKGHAVAFLDFKISNFFLNRLISLYKPSFIFCEKKRLYKSKLYNLRLNFKSYVLYKREKNINVSSQKETKRVLI